MQTPQKKTEKLKTPAVFTSREAKGLKLEIGNFLNETRMRQGLPPL